MKRVVYTKGQYDNQEKWVLKKEYSGFGIYNQVCPTGFPVHQEYLITDGKDLTIISHSFNHMCMEELLDCIDNFMEEEVFGLKCFNRTGTYIVHPNGNVMV